MTARDHAGNTLNVIYDALHRAFGPQHWWPGDTRDEVVIGAVLTQNTAWTNVERAIQRLRSATVLTLAAVHAAPERSLAQLIRPAGTYRVKARRLKALVRWIYADFQGDLDVLFATEPGRLRRSLIAVPGIGPETADAILLYAGGVPTFVVDAYTRRICRRHFLIEPRADYEHTRALFERHLPADADRYGEYHALLVELGKRYCRVRASCDACPLRSLEHDATL